MMASPPSSRMPNSMRYLLLFEFYNHSESKSDAKVQRKFKIFTKIVKESSKKLNKSNKDVMQSPYLIYYDSFTPV